MQPNVEGHLSDKSRLLRLSVLFLAVLGAGCLVASFPKLAQDKSYHLFADSRSLFGINNWSNVLSNAGFTVAGIVGLVRTRHLAVNTPVFIWRSFFAAIIIVGFGSAYYHLAPSNETLLWDRLPMTLGFASLVAGISGERFGARAGRLLFCPLILIGAFSVLYWWYTEQAGAGDLRPYILVQFLPMLVVPLIILLFSEKAECNRPYWILLISYIIAKVFEWQDAALFAATGHLVGGHALKHLAAAAGLLMFRPAGAGGDGVKPAGGERSNIKNE